MSRSVIALFAALGVSATLPAQAPPAPRALLGPKTLWTISTGLAAPESAYYHFDSNSVFVSNINGQALAKDGNGYITRIAPSGRVLAEKWATGLNAPKGIRSIGNTIWVADIDEVVGFEIAAGVGRLVSRVKVEGSQFLNDLAIAPDGTIYLSDSNQARIYLVKDGKVSVFIEAADVGGQPNGLLVDGNRLIVGMLGPGAARGGAGASAGGALMAFDVKTKVRTMVTTEPVGGIDGIEAAENGGLLVTDVVGRRLLHVYPTGTVVPLIAFDQAGADFGYVPVTVTRPTALAYGPVAIVPFLFGNSISAYALDTGVGGR